MCRTYSISTNIANNTAAVLDTGDIPKYWRDANISSMFKKGDKYLPENYRPASLTSFSFYDCSH
jgi:hypothetical protein